MLENELFAKLPMPYRPLPKVNHWVTVRKPKEMFSDPLSVMAEIKKATVRTSEGPDRSFGLGS